jgi:beta-lactam-binding protein with PASTA domain
VARRTEPNAPTVAFAGQDAVAVPDLSGQTVRGVTEECSRLGLVPSLIGSGVALEQFPGAGTQVLRGSRVTVRFGRPGEVQPVSSRGNGN